MAWRYSIYTTKVDRICDKGIKLSNRNRREQEKSKAVHQLVGRQNGGADS